MSQLPPVVQQAGDHIQSIIREGEERVNRLLNDVEKSSKVKNKELSPHNVDEISAAVAKYLDQLKLRVYDKLHSIKSSEASQKWQQVRGGDSGSDKSHLKYNIHGEAPIVPETKGSEIAARIEGEKPPQAPFIETKRPLHEPEHEKSEFKTQKENYQSSNEMPKPEVYYDKSHKMLNVNIKPYGEEKHDTKSSLNPFVEEFHPKKAQIEPEKSDRNVDVLKKQQQDVRPEEIAAKDPSLKSTTGLSDIYKSPFETRLYTSKEANVKAPSYDIPPPIMHKDDEQIKKQQEQFASQVLPPHLQPREAQGFVKLEEPQHYASLYASRTLEDIETSKYQEDKSLLDRTSELASVAAEKTSNVAGAALETAGDVVEGISEYVEQLKNEVAYKWEDIKDTLTPQHHRDLQDELLGHAEREEKFQEEIRDVGCDF